MIVPLISRDCLFASLVVLFLCVASFFVVFSSLFAGFVLSSQPFVGFPFFYFASFEIKEKERVFSLSPRFITGFLR